MPSFPVFDLSRFEQAGAEERRKLGREVDDICRSTGFLAISGHSVPQATIDGVWRAAHDFFDLPQETKDAVRAPYPGYPYGYLGSGAEALAKSKGVDTPPDLKESFNGGPLKIPAGLTDAQALSFCYAETIWPVEPEGFVEAWKDYYGAMEDLAARIMRVFAVALSLPEGFFEKSIDAPISALRALELSRNIDAAEAGATAGRRPYRLRQPDHPSAAAWFGRAADIHAGRRMARGAAGAQRLRHQHWRPDGAMDQRPLGVDAAPCRQRRRERCASAVAGVLPPAELACRDRLSQILPDARRNNRFTNPCFRGRT